MKNLGETIRPTIFKELKKPVRQQYYAVVVMFDELPLYSLHKNRYSAFSRARRCNPLYRINVKPKQRVA